MYFCPCCGYRVLYEQPPDTYLVCPICFWEDIEEIYGLRQAQLNFVSFGACASEWLKQVRRPTEKDERDPNWQLLDEKIKTNGTKIIQQVMSAFKNVKLEDGISLNEANEIYLIEDYAYLAFSINSSEAEALLAKANATDIDSDWQEISEENLSEFIDSGGIFYYYLDLKGWRYYLPAYMIWSLNRYIEYDYIDGLHDVVDIFLAQEQHRVFDRIQRDFHQRNKAEYLASITVEQKSAIYKFLQFVINYSTGYEREGVQEIMERHCKYLCENCEFQDSDKK